MSLIRKPVYFINGIKIIWASSISKLIFSCYGQNKILSPNFFLAFLFFCWHGMILTWKSVVLSWHMHVDVSRNMSYNVSKFPTCHPIIHLASIPLSLQRKYMSSIPLPKVVTARGECGFQKIFVESLSMKNQYVDFFSPDGSSILH